MQRNIISLLVAGIILIMGGSFLYFVYKTENQRVFDKANNTFPFLPPLSSLPQQEQVNFDVVYAKGKPDENGWYTFRSEEYKFEIKYPPNYAIDKHSNVAIGHRVAQPFLLIFNEKGISTKNCLDIQQIIVEVAYGLEPYKYYKLEIEQQGKLKEVIVNDSTYRIYEIPTFLGDQICLDNDIALIKKVTWAKSGDAHYMIKLSGYEPNPDELFKEILATFRALP